MRAPVRAIAVTAAVAAVMMTAAGTAAANELPGRFQYWEGEKQVQHVQMGDPWVFRGQTPYEVTTQPTCWIYSDRRDVVAELYTTAHDRYPPFPTGLDRLFFPVYETVTVDWHNTTTGQRGQAVGHGDRGQTVVGIPGGDGVIEMDIRLRSDHPWMHAVGSTHLPFGYVEGTTHAVTDLRGKSCP